MTEKVPAKKETSFSSEEVLNDYRLAYLSRQMSLIGRREVMSGKAKFGIFGDGKELPQLAMAKAFRKGDFRSGYYRDQTFMLAIGELTAKEFFAQLYAHADVEADPASAGRSMIGHYSTRSLNPDGSWKNLAEQFNSSPDVSPTGSQMPRLVGLAYGSRLYRELKELHKFTQFSHQGSEIAFGTIGNASTAEGIFWEAVNAIGVLKAPVLLSIWDDEYGISVSNEYQMTKENISELLSGFKRETGSDQGFDIYTIQGWDYPLLVDTYLQAADIVRQKHIPAIIHVIELTQPQGHSTSGSHERYKDEERLKWESEHDGLTRFRQWIIENNLANAADLDQIEEEEKRNAEKTRQEAWEDYITPILAEREFVAQAIDKLSEKSSFSDQLNDVRRDLLKSPNPLRRDSFSAILKALTITKDESIPSKNELREWKADQEKINSERYSSHMHSQSIESALNVPIVEPKYSPDSPSVYGFEVLNACFDAALARDPRIIAFGQDVGRLGDVNQGFRGLQKKYGELRVTDTGIREATIVGQAIGMAMRGLKPIAEIQYLDYLLYALQIMSDDLAILHWRTKADIKRP